MLIRIFDADRSGTIGYQEFCYLWDYLSKWKAAFDGFDTDKSGTISFKEAYTALSTFGYRLSEPLMKLLFYSYDQDATNALGFDEFVQMNAELSSMTNLFVRRASRLHVSELAHSASIRSGGMIPMAQVRTVTVSTLAYLRHFADTGMRVVCAGVATINYEQFLSMVLTLKASDQ